MLSLETVLEADEFMARADLGLVEVEDRHKFLVDHASRDFLLVSRGEDGAVRALLFGWPFNGERPEGGDVPAVAEDGEAFYANLLVLSECDIAECLMELKHLVLERWPGVGHFAYRRAKHGDRYALRPMDRLAFRDMVKHG